MVTNEDQFNYIESALDEINIPKHSKAGATFSTWGRVNLTLEKLKEATEILTVFYGNLATHDFGDKGDLCAYVDEKTLNRLESFLGKTADDYR